MTHDFQNMMRRFQDIQIFSLEKSRDFVVRAREIASTSPTSAETAGDDSAQKSEGGEKEPLLSREYHPPDPLLAFANGAVESWDCSDGSCRGLTMKSAIIRR